MWNQLCIYICTALDSYSIVLLICHHSHWGKLASHVCCYNLNFNWLLSVFICTSEATSFHFNSPSQPKTSPSSHISCFWLKHLHFLAEDIQTSLTETPIIRNTFYIMTHKSCEKYYLLMIYSNPFCYVTLFFLYLNSCHRRSFLESNWSFIHLYN